MLSPRGRRLRASAALGAAALASTILTGCGAEGLIGAGAQLGAACAAAQVAWLPGVSSADAYAAIDEATRIVDETLATTPGLPGAAEIDQALSTAREALGADQTEFGVARETLQTACALVSMGG